jgi:hypothetical protein
MVENDGSSASIATAASYPGQVDAEAEMRASTGCGQGKPERGHGRARLIVALAGVHAARSSAVCALRLSDAGLGSRRLLLGGQPRPLDDLTAHLLRAWLETRRTRWPGTANPHLLISAQTALGTGPVSRTWVNTTLRGHAATIEALRVDRQLEEALASGADPLHLATTFGLDPGTAVRYASSARQLLQTAAEQQDPAGFPANPRAGSAQEG